MIKKVLMLAGVIGLTGCGNPDRIDFEHYDVIKIKEKSTYKENFCNYTLRTKASAFRYPQESYYILPNNFGEVGYVVKVTNGIQAWKP